MMLRWLWKLSWLEIKIFMREPMGAFGGILKRLRATPLRPQTILTAQVIVKLILTAATLALMVLAGKRYYPVGVHAPLFSFTIALLISTWSILSIGFLIASIVPT